jgi:hypothetical protein
MPITMELSIVQDQFILLDQKSYFYTPPSILSVLPPGGLTTGGTVVQITFEPVLLQYLHLVHVIPVMFGSAMVRRKESQICRVYYIYIYIYIYIYHYMF